MKETRPPAHGIARGSLQVVAQRVRAAGAAEANQRRGSRAGRFQSCDGLRVIAGGNYDKEFVRLKLHIAECSIPR